MTIKNNVNHVVFILDASGSMSGHASNVIRVFDKQISHLAARSKEMDQETRVSVYTFNTKTQCVIFDKDVLRLPSLAAHYGTGGGTALIDGTISAIGDLRKLPEIYGDHAFLAYVLTDGDETQRPSGANELAALINSLPENWTVAALVPDQNGVFAAKRVGFPANNVCVWNAASSQGVDEAGDTITRSTEAYMQARAQGARSTKNLFALNTAKVTASAVKSKLTELTPSEYTLLNVRKKDAIKPFVESWKIEYRLGAAYYQLTKAGSRPVAQTDLHSEQGQRQSLCGLERSQVARPS